MSSKAYPFLLKSVHKKYCKLAVNKNISYPIFSNIYIDKYKYTLFERQAIEILGARCCLLCHKYHPVRIFQRRPRHVKTDIGYQKTIKIFRVLCIDNLSERRKTGKPLQYTVTILPSFLVPYSRIQVNKIFSAIKYYITANQPTLLKAAFLMDCVNISSFRRYYLRFLIHINNWILFIIQITIALGGESKQEEIKEIKGREENGIKHRWHRFQNYKKKYFYIHSQIPNNIIVIEKLQNQYLHVLFCGNRMGLGP